MRARNQESRFHIAYSFQHSLSLGAPFLFKQPNSSISISLTVGLALIQHPAYLNYAEYIMRNAGLDEAQIGIKIAGRNINNLCTPMIHVNVWEKPLKYCKVISLQLN